MGMVAVIRYNRGKLINYFNEFIRRNKHKDTHWSVKAKMKSPKNKALQYFDDAYRGFYGSEWPSIRLALLSPQKYCALVNNFGDTEETISYLKELGAIDIKDIFDAELKISNLYGLENKMTENICDSYPESHNDEGQMTEKSIEVNVDHKENSTLPNPVSLRSTLANAEIEHDRIVKPGLLGVSATALHEFVPATQLKGMEDYVLESDHYKHYEEGESFPLTKVKENKLNYPSHLKVLSFIRGNISRFPSPRRGKAGVYNYYLMDCASILPVLALDLTLGDKILDMCAAPGGKSLLMLQTLYPDFIVSNDIQPSRVERISGIMNDYLFSMKSWKNKIKVTKGDGRNIEEQHKYNKILVDVPCTTDRHSVLEDDNNIFNANRIKERIKLPEVQAALLSNALKIVSPGGIVVYSTCSLSPIQNDGVVHAALKSIWEETNIEVEIRDISPALKVTKNVFKLSENKRIKYGQVVIPFLPNNFGPSYFCKLVRKK